MGAPPPLDLRSRTGTLSAGATEILCLTALERFRRVVAATRQDRALVERTRPLGLRVRESAREVRRLGGQAEVGQNFPGRWTFLDHLHEAALSAAGALRGSIGHPMHTLQGRTTIESLHV